MVVACDEDGHFQALANIPDLSAHAAFCGGDSVENLRLASTKAECVSVRCCSTAGLTSPEVLIERTIAGRSQAAGDPHS
jgi:hypothetical protein